VAFVVFSLLFLAVGGYLVYEQEQALRSYESTEATVLGTEVDRDVDRETGEPDSVTYTPIVEYRYRVDGQTYTARNVYPGGTSARSDRGWAQGVVDDYRQGETVTAYYDPADTSEAYLIKQRDLTKFAFVVLPLGFLGMGLLLVWRAGWANDDSEEAPATGGTRDRSGVPSEDTTSEPSGGPTADDSGSSPGVDSGESSDDGVEYGDWGDGRG
jgi:Protein of unknown function (DUF3592).